MTFSFDKHQIAREQLGLFFAERRKEMGHDMKVLADFVGISENTMKRIEAGKFDFDISLLFKICEALEIKPYFIPFELANDFETKFPDDEPDVKHPDLVDAWAMSVVHGQTFDIPDNKAFLNLKPGDLIKVNASGERFWCKIVEIKDNDFIGQVDNDLVSTDSHGLVLGDLIFIRPNNVYQIYDEGKN